MDRVLLVYEDTPEANHLQATLRKVGFDVEAIANEYSLSEKLLSFNPDIMLVYGKGHKFNTVVVGKKLKDSFRFAGKVVLIFPPNLPPQPQDILDIRVDVLVQAPVGALQIVRAILKLSGRDTDAILDKLVRIAETDASFRAAENKVLSGSGKNVDSELLILKNTSQNDGVTFVPSGKSIGSLIAPNEPTPKPAIDDSVGENIKRQILEAKEHETFRTASYKAFTDKVVANPRAQLKKTTARKKQKELLKDWDAKELEDQDELRKEFANALGKEFVKK